MSLARFSVFPSSFFSSLSLFRALFFSQSPYSAPLASSHAFKTASAPFSVHPFPFFLSFSTLVSFVAPLSRAEKSLSSHLRR